MVDLALERWQKRNIRADNTSAIVLLLNPPADCDNPKLKSCENQAIEKLTCSWISPSKPCLLPIHQNLQSSVGEKRQRPVTPLCGKVIVRKPISKEDRTSVKWPKQRRKSVPGFRIRWANIGSADGRRKLKVIARRHSVPTINVRNMSCSPLVLLTTPDKLSLRTMSRARMELLSKSTGQTNLCKLHRRLDISLSGSDSPKRATSVTSREKLTYSTEKATAVEGSDGASLPVNEPRVTADPTSLDYSVIDDFTTPSVFLNHPPDLNSSELSPALQLKRKRVEVVDLPTKQPCRVASCSDVLQTYRTRYHTRLRISQGCVTHSS